MTDVIRGRAWKFGDDVNTDVITPGKYLTIRDPEQLAPHVMEGIDPDFTKKAGPGDLIVAGTNFGCGSSRETAPAAAAAIADGADVEVDVAAGRITDRTTGRTFEAAPFPPFLRELMAAGGLVAYTRRRLGLGDTPR